MKLEDLKREIPFKWCVNSLNKNKDKAMVVAHIDARDVMDLLDEVIGVGNWQNEFYSQGVNTFCKIGIKIGNEWIWKSDTGSISANEPEKSLASDSFKRAAVQWGIGRFLYKIDPIWFNYNDNTKKCLDENYKPIYDLSEYCNNLYKSKNKRSAPKRELPQVIENKTDNSSDISDQFEKSQQKQDLMNKIEECKGLTQLNNTVNKYQAEINSFSLNDLVNAKRSSLWRSWFELFKKEVQMCETKSDIDKLKEKHKFLLESKDYKGFCEKLISETIKNLKVA